MEEYFYKKGREIHMNILVLGNGFDLAHGLPTRYTDFLEFVKVIEQVMKRKYLHDVKLDWDGIDGRIKGKINHDMRDLSSFEKKWKELVDNNVWIDYFLQCDIYQKENWIDFESEIGKIIQLINADMRGEDFDDKIEILSNDYFMDYYRNHYMTIDDLLKKKTKLRLSYRELRDDLCNDLNRVIRALEIYIADYVQKIDCKLISPDIQRILPKEIAKSYGVPLYDTYVLVFNYTNTYQRLYFDKTKAYFENIMHYIHGKADIENTIETNNMVLGIDEYLPDDRKDKETEFIAFKKYYQRIYKGTGSKYKEWVEIIRENWQGESEESKAEIRKCISRGKLKNDKIHNLYIFGHSLDATDKDILRDLILNDNVYTTIFYHKKDELGRKIANLVKVIGQDELIRRTGGSTRTIRFELQQDMVPIKE